MTACVAILGGAQPAAAVTPDPGTALSAAQTAYEMWKRYKGQDDLSVATREIVNAVGAARDDINAHIEAVDATGVRSCALAAMFDVPDMPNMTQDTLQDFARDTTRCVTDATVKIDEMTAKGVVDELGFALHTLAPIALVAREKSGFSTSQLEAEIARSSNVLLQKLKPACYVNKAGDDRPPTPGYEVVVNCYAYNGDKGTDYQFISPTKPVSYTKAKLEAQRNTSDMLAREALREGTLN